MQATKEERKKKWRKATITNKQTKQQQQIKKT